MDHIGYLITSYLLIAIMTFVIFIMASFGAKPSKTPFCCIKTAFCAVSFQKIRRRANQHAVDLYIRKILIPCDQNISIADHG